MDEQNLNLCPNCFNTIDGVNTTCGHCGYTLSKKSKNVYALPPMTVITQRYVLGRVLGSGGFGVTYLAKDLLTEELCAIKEYLPFDWVYRKGTDLCPVSEQKRIMFEHGKKRFLDEAKMLVRFKEHKNIVQVLNFFASNNTAYLVMEYLNGANFRTLINRKGGKVSLSVAQEVFLTTAHALEEVHAQNVLHRDISAENIFITKDASVKLIDFGSARQIAADSDKSLSVMLKPGTAPLEQYSSKGNQGPWTDIYSLASTFYHAVTGTAVPEATERMNDDKMIPISELCPSITQNWSKVIEKSLRVSYKDRYQSIAELLDDINQSSLITPPPPPPPPPPPTPKAFIFIEKSQQGVRGSRKIYLEDYKKYSLGRSMQKSDIVVDMADCVSRQHCVIAYIPQENCFFIKDTSANGTYLSNGFRLANERFEKVEPNSVIFLGTTNTAIRVAIE